jgi:hypothetical protein
MKPFIIAIAVVVLGGLGYVGYTQIHDDSEPLALELATATTTALNSSNKKIAFSELVKQGGSYECTVKQAVSDMESDGVVFMDKDRLYGEFSTIAEGMKVDTTMIMKDGYTYTWSSMAPKNGFKIKIATNEIASNEVDASGTYRWSAEQIGDYYCEKWVVDESKFTVPTEIKFVEVKK